MAWGSPKKKPPKMVRRWDGSLRPETKDPWGRHSEAEKFHRRNKLKENAWWSSESETYIDMGERSPRDRPDGSPGTFNDLWRERAQEKKEMGWFQRWLHAADPPSMKRRD